MLNCIPPIYGYIALGIVGLGVIGYLLYKMGWFIFHPVDRDRVFFGNSPWNLIIYNIVLIVVVGALLWGASEVFHIEASTLLQENSEGKKDISKFWAVISQMADPGNLPMASTNAARTLALICAICGIVFLSGLLIASIVNVLTKRSQKWQQGMLRYNLGFNKYVLIIGVNDQTATLAKLALQRTDVDYVLIQTSQDVEKMRMRLALDLDRKEEDCLVFYFGDRTSREDIYALHPEKAVEIYILGEDFDLDTEHDHDAFNIQCLTNISQCLKDKRGLRIRCHVNFEYQSTFTAFKSTHIYRSLDKNVEFVPFNTHEIWAKKVMVDNYALIPTGKKNEVTSQSYLPLDSEKGISADSDKTVHLIIIGMNQMGTALASQAALIAHYPNFHRNRRLRTTITFIDERAVIEGQYFRGRYGHLFDLCRYRIFPTDENLTQKISQDNNWIDPMNTVNENGSPFHGRYAHLRDDDPDPNFMDIQWEFIQANVASEEIREYLSYAATKEDTITTIAICSNHSQKAIATSLYMPEQVYRGVYQILVYQQNNFDLIKKVGTGEKIWKRYNKLRPFGMIERSYTEATFDNSNAKMLYYFYMTGKVGNHRPSDGYFAYDPIPDMTADDSIVIDARLDKEINNLWNQLGIVEKLSNIAMVDTIPSKLRSLGLSIDSLDEFDQKIQKDNNLEYLSKAEHTRWVVERLLMGYRPLLDTEKEWQCFPPVKADNDPKELKKRKRHKKEIEKKKRAHLDICSNRMLAKVDPNAPYNDMNMMLYIPQILRYAEWLRILRMSESTTFAQAQRMIFTVSGEGNSELAMRLVVDYDKNKALWIMDSPVTQGQWEYFMGSNPVKNPGYRSKKKPVVNVSRIDVENFINVVRKKTGLLLDLPTREEWKMVAELTDIPKDVDKEQKSKALWINRHDNIGPSKVRTLKSRQSKYHNYGVFDMLGNVWEWTKEIDPKGSTEKKLKKDNAVFFGGSWQHGLDKCDYRHVMSAETELQSDDVGFRLVWRFDLSSLGEKRDEILPQIEYLAKCDRDTQAEDIRRKFKLGPEYTKEQIIKALENQFVRVEGGYFAMAVPTPEVDLEIDDSDSNNSDNPSSEKDDSEGDNSENSDSKTGNSNEPKIEKPYFVKVDDFYMLKTPVTQKLWNLVMDTTPFNNPSQGCIGDFYPQTEISWDNVASFLDNLSKTIGIKFKLPTSAQWEYAAKEGQKSDINKQLTEIFKQDIPVDEKWSKAREILQNSTYPEFSGECESEGITKVDLGVKNHSDLYEVGFYEPNHLGLYDMAGCVCEWCNDYYQDGHIESRLHSEEYQQKGYDSNPKGPKLQYGDRVWRGGGWDSNEEDCKSTFVSSTAQRDMEGNLGFRIVISAKEYEKSKRFIHWVKD